MMPSFRSRTFSVCLSVTIQIPTLLVRLGVPSSRTQIPFFASVFCVQAAFAGFVGTGELQSYPPNSCSPRSVPPIPAAATPGRTPVSQPVDSPSEQATKPYRSLLFAPVAEGDEPSDFFLRHQILPQPRRSTEPLLGASFSSSFF